MRKTYRVLGYLIAAEVVVQAMAIAYALAGLGYWISEDGGVLNKQVLDSEPEFAGVGGFMVHGINGMMLVPLLALLFLLVSFFTKLPGASRRAAAVVGLVVLQVFLGILTHSLPFSAALHALNAFVLLVVAITSARRARDSVAAGSTVDARVGAPA
jgi:heme A synthase